MEAALQLAWDSNHAHYRVVSDCNLACLVITNVENNWSWRAALGMDGWLYRWELTGWRSATGKRVSHSDIWRRILRWLRLFESAPNRSVYVSNMKAHTGEHGNEWVDKLTEEGSALRFRLMELATPHNWFHNTLNVYWPNRI